MAQNVEACRSAPVRWACVEWRIEASVCCTASFHFKSRHMSKKYRGPWISGVTRKTLKAKVAKHYKAYHDIQDMGLAEQDRLVVEWATALIEDLYPAAVHNIPSDGS